MAIARRDGSVTVLEQFVKKDWFPIRPRYCQGFKKEAERFGRPDFVEDDNIAAFIASFTEKVLPQHEVPKILWKDAEWSPDPVGVPRLAC
jgi:hypothetical protein